MSKLISLLLLVLSSGVLTAQSTADYKKLDTALNLLYQTHRFNGTVLYAENGKVLYKKAFGVVDYRTNQPLTTHSAFNLASISKQFTSIGIMLLKEKGKLQYDDDCKKYIPEFPYEGITIRNLMTHTSGLPEYFDLFELYKNPLDTLDNNRMIDIFAGHKPALEFATGTQWSYCNTNYALLASIIERISKEPFNVFFKKNIADPLNLNDTYVYHVLMPFAPANYVYGFEETGENRKLNDLTPFDGVVGDGNIYSSVEDLYKWEQSLYTEKLVKKETLQEAFQPVKLKDGNSYPYGFGWFITEDKEQYYWHTGGWTGFSNLIYRDTKNKRTLILLSSGSNDWGSEVASDFFEGKPIIFPTTSLISNVVLIDGTGLAGRNAAVRIEGEKIIAVGNLQPFTGEEVVDGKGKILSPGFIDTHSHLLESLLEYPEALAALNQGITTIVAGQDGESDPVDSVKAQLVRIPAAINVATYTGHASIREKIMGKENLARPATEDELGKIKELLRDDLQKGSLGLSTGLEYEEGFYSDRHEVVELAKVAGEEGGRYISHLRSEDINMSEAIDEIINIGIEAKLPVQISHIKIALKDNWGTSPQLLANLQNARSQGVDITADCYPYTFWNSTVRVLFPKKDFTSMQGAAFATAHLFDPSGSVMVRFEPDSNYKGKTVSAIAAMRNETPEQTLLYLVAASGEYEKKYPDADAETIMGKSMSEVDVSNFIAWPNTNICSDGGNGGHPRGYGSFTKVLSYYVKEKKLMTWEEAIYKMTGLSAEHTGITDRGVIAPGYYADLVLIDPETVKDNSTIEDSKALSDGILKVWVNGVLVYADKKSQQKFPGEFVARKMD